MNQLKINYIIQNVHFMIRNKTPFWKHLISAHFVSPSHVCMHVLKFTLILRVVPTTMAYIDYSLLIV
jgi:hypothetical protein